MVLVIIHSLFLMMLQIFRYGFEVLQVDLVEVMLVVQVVLPDKVELVNFQSLMVVGL